MTRPAWLTAMGLAVAVAGTAGLVLSRASGAAPVPPPARAAIAVQRILTPWLPTGPGTVADAVPDQLIIPAIGLRTRLIRLGLTRSGTLQVPDTTDVAGWFDDGPAPGQPGPAIIAGHIDSVSGPAVFYDLSQLRSGDRVYVRRSDGTVVVFKVTGLRMYLKSAFPTAVVYGPAPGAQLRLITCGGAFSHRRHSYLGNLVVSAVLTKLPSETAERPLTSVANWRFMGVGAGPACVTLGGYGGRCEAWAGTYGSPAGSGASHTGRGDGNHSRAARGRRTAGAGQARILLGERLILSGG